MARCCGIEEVCVTIDKMIEFIENFKEPEQKFVDFAVDINGLVGPGSVALLNGCVKFIDPGKNCYLEAGSFQGMSLIGAAMGNYIDCFGVENFAEEFKDNWGKHDSSKRSNKQILEYHLEKFGAVNCEMFYQDYREFFAGREDVGGCKVEVYLYDALHTFEHQVAGLLLAIPVLADRAIVFVDDYKCPHVPKAIERVVGMNKGFTEIKHWVEPYENFREGFVALEFNRGSQ